MSTVTATIDIDAPITTVYNQWTQFESFPQFMSGVDEVRQV
ncbi:MAG TPA: SRPBCC family protein, partial [Microcella sp.]|nr:SRPBCC family protein [Microcella sp.]